MANTTLYEILEVSPQASAAVIRAAYRCLVQRHHPDKNPLLEQAGPMLAAINLAYAVLSDPERRRAYDRRCQLYPQLSERRGRGSNSSTHRADAHAAPSPARPFVFRPLTHD